MVKVNVTDNTLLTLLVPGGVIALALGLLSLATDPGLGTRVLKAVAQTGMTLDFDRGAFTAAVFVIGLLAVYVVAMVLGAVVASVAGYVEAHFLDRWCWQRLRLDETQYQLHWKRYVAHLEDHDTANSYIAKHARSFHFECRTALALFVFAGAALCAAAEDVAGWWLPVSSFLAAAALWKTGMDDHEMLARYRRDRFSSPDDSVYKGDQLVRQAISSWCQREQLEPLRVLLAGWPPKTWNREEMTTLIRLLEQIEGMPDTIVRHEEREKLAKAVAQFRTTI